VPTESFNEEQLIACAKGALFEGNRPKLPSDNMLMMSRITTISDEGGVFDKGHIIAEFDIKPDHWFFQCHFKDDPVMPGCLGLDALWQLVGFYLSWQGYEGRGRALAVDQVRFSGEILPTAKKVVYHIDMKRVYAKKLVIGLANGTVSVDGQLIYRAENLRVGVITGNESN
jgi:3-hydroxyacyl-[acyl-carrier protein] dehydratase / trans-2-decenoyl-[acyl-carrier protein] isomerase